MSIYREITDAEVAQLHDFYFESSEPDAPKSKFSDLSEMKRLEAKSRYALENHYIVLDKDEVIGFFGIYPQPEARHLDIFYVVNPVLRGQGFLVRIIESLVECASLEYGDYKKLRAATRAINVASVRGLKRAGFHFYGTHTEEYSDNPADDVDYEIYMR